MDQANSGVLLVSARNQAECYPVNLKKSYERLGAGSLSEMHILYSKTSRVHIVQKRQRLDTQ